MRGLKRRGVSSVADDLECRAIRPAYEGIETYEILLERPTVSLCRAIRPAYEGIETESMVRLPRVQAIRCRAIRPAYEGIETFLLSKVSLISF